MNDRVHLIEFLWVCIGRGVRVVKERGDLYEFNYTSPDLPKKILAKKINPLSFLCSDNIETLFNSELHDPSSN